MKKINIHVGCSAFNNTYWKGIFYPENLARNKWFDFYASQFGTYELNGTFYKPPTVKSLKTWYAKVPDDFIFSVKAPKLITHFKKFNDCQTEIDDFYTVCREGLAEKLGCILFQLPPSFDFSPEKLELILDSLHPEFNNVVEFRNQSWWRDEVFEAFRLHNITFCNVSFPNLPNELIATSAIGYIRLHGVPKLFYSGYDSSFLDELQNQILKQQKWQKVFLYFNNTAGIEGILNAIAMQKLVGTKV